MFKFEKNKKMNEMGLLDRFKKRGNLSPEKEEASLETLKLIQAKKYDEALVLHEKFFDQDSEADWYSKGNLLTNLNRQKEAIDCYLKAIELKDTYIKAWFRLGQRYFEFQHYTEARNAMVKVSMMEQKIGENEWNTLATFYYMMSLYLEYINTKNEEIKEKIPDQIRKLRKIIANAMPTQTKRIVQNATDDYFLEFCEKNFQDILNKLEPNVIFEARHDKSVN